MTHPQFEFGNYSGWFYPQPPNVPFELNEASPQADGLVAWWPAINRDEVHHDLMRRTNFTEVGTVGWSFRDHGPMGDFPGTDDYLTASAPVITVPLTLSGWAIVDSGVSAWSWRTMVWIGIGAAAGAGEHFALKLNIRATANVWKAAAQTRDGAGVSTALSADITKDNAFAYHFCAVFHSTSNREIYFSGQYAANDLVARAPAGLDTLCIGVEENWGGASLDWWGQLSDVRVYDRALCRAEVYQLYANPWQLCRPLRRWWPGATVAAPTTQLILTTYAGYSQPVG